MGAEPRLLGTSAAARRLNVSSQTVRRFIEAGKLPAVRTPLGHLLDAGEVERLAAERAAQARRGGDRGVS